MTVNQTPSWLRRFESYSRHHILEGGFLIEKSVLEQFYQKEHLSMMEISKKLHVSVNQVVWWMGRYDITRRSWSEATYVKRNPQGDPFRIKTNLSLQEAELKGIGLGIFWGEGNKTTKYGIKVGNTDHRLINKFIEFLTKICGVDRGKLRFSLIIFNDSDPVQAINYWISRLNIKEEQIGKPTIIPPQGKGTYKNKSKYGVLTVGCFNTKLRKWLDKELGFHS